MSIQSNSIRKSVFAGAAIVLSIGFAVGAGAATRPGKAASTQEWGSDLQVAPEDDEESAVYLPKRPQPTGTRPVTGKDTVLAPVDYCLELTPSEGTDGPYRLQFHFLGGETEASANRPAGAGRKPSGHHALVQATTTASLTFDFESNIDGTISSGGDVSLVGAFYDGEDELVATDDEEGRLSVLLSAGEYSFVIQGDDQLTGSYQMTADQGTCN
jgi:hypothetical protein